MVIYGFFQGRHESLPSRELFRLTSRENNRFEISQAREYKSRGEITNFSLDLESGNSEESNVSEFIPGHFYSIRKKDIDLGVTFQFVKKVRLDNEREILIVKQYDTRESPIPTLFINESDCERFGIPYEKGLSIISSDYNFSDRGKDNPDNKKNPNNDLGDYFQEEASRLNIKLEGFKRSGDILIMPDSSLVDLQLFMISLRIRLKKELLQIGNFTGFSRGESLSFRFVDHDIVGKDGSIKLEVSLIKSNTCVSGLVFRGKSLKSLLEITWNNSFSLNASNCYSKTYSGYPNTRMIVSHVFKKIGDQWWRDIDNMSYY